MFHYWCNLPPELRKVFTDWFPTKTKFNLAACSVASFYEACDSFDHITAILVKPQAKYPIAKKFWEDDAVPQYEIYVLDDNGMHSCFWLDILRKDDSTSIVQFSVEDLQNGSKTKQWETLMDGAYEVLASRFLEMLLGKCHKTLVTLQIASASPSITELPFNSFNIRQLKKLEVLHIASKNYDLLQCGFTNLEQIQSIAVFVYLGNTLLPLAQISGVQNIVVNQNNLTLLDILEYLKFLMNSEFENRSLVFELVDSTKPNYFDMTIKYRIKRVMKTVGRVQEWCSSSTYAELCTRGRNGSIKIVIEVGKRLQILSSKPQNPT